MVAYRLLPHRPIVREYSDNLRELDRFVLRATDCWTNFQTVPVINTVFLLNVSALLQPLVTTQCAPLHTVAIRHKHIACTCNRYAGDWRYGWLTADCTFRYRPIVHNTRTRDESVNGRGVPRVSAVKGCTIRAYHSAVAYLHCAGEYIDSITFTAKPTI